MNIFLSFFSFFSFGKEAKNGGITAVVRGVNVWGNVFGSLLGSISLATMLPQSRASKSIKKGKENPSQTKTHLRRLLTKERKRHAGLYDICPPLYETASHHIFYVLAQHEWAKMQKLPRSTAAEF